MFLEDIIANLQTFWKTKGCLVLQPLDMPVGAGTLAPPTALRCALRHPWSACYVQGCRRPKDGRYASNPSRLSHYYQFQVVMLPSPSQAQALYLESLEALSIDPGKHDIRFLEDDWENPSIGASGLGWEIWLDGLEVTQCTFFQKLGGLPSLSPTLEFTYGLERLALYLQDKSSVFDLQWNANTSYGDIFEHQEKDLSAFYFEYANVEVLHRDFTQYLKDAHELLQHNVLISAYEKGLFASYAFNILDSRGTLSASEREESLTKIRHLTRDIIIKFRERHA